MAAQPWTNLDIINLYSLYVSQLGPLGQFGALLQVDRMAI